MILLTIQLLRFRIKIQRKPLFHGGKNINIKKIGFKNCPNIEGNSIFPSIFESADNVKHFL